MDTPRKVSSEQREEWRKAIFSVVDNISFIITDLAGQDAHILDFSPGAEGMFGYTRDEALEQPVGMLHLAEDVAKFPEVLEAMSRRQQGFIGELTLVRKSGDRFPALWTTFPLRDDQGEMIAAMGVTIDISARKDAETALIESRNELRHTCRILDFVLNAFPDVIGILTPDQSVVRYNTAGYAMLKIAPEETVGRKCYEIIGRNTPCELCATIIAKSNGQPARIEKYVENLELWLDCRSYPVHDETGQLIYIVEHLRDITERKRTEQALRRNEELLRSIFDGFLDGISLLDNHLNVIKTNVWMERMYAHAMPLCGKKCYQVYHERNKPCERCPSIRTLNSGTAQMEIVPYHTDEGDIGWVELSAYPLFDDEGAVSGIVEHVKDITARKRAEEKLRETEELLHQSRKMDAIGQLAGGVAHDFNNQLTGIVGFADLLRRELDDKPMLAHFCDNILLTAKRAADLTAQLLAFARKGKYLSVEVDLHRLIFEVVSILKHCIDKRIAIKQMLNAGISTTIGDPSQLHNAILNLALNARDAMPDGGEMVFATDVVELDKAYCASKPYAISPGCFIRLCVTDTGIGMDESLQKKIFEPFFTTKEQGKGSGMGLAAVYGTMKNHHGAISVYSEPDHGSSFKLYLPVLDPEGRETTTAIDQNSKPVRQPLSILLVDDKDIICNVGCMMLEKLGHTVTLCTNGKEAVDLYKQKRHAIDLVILDMVMPVMNGHDAFQAMKKIDPNVKALLSSGYSLNGEAQKILDQGVMGFVQKPFNLKDLEDALDRVMS